MGFTGDPERDAKVWLKAIHGLFEPFLEFCYPQIHSRVDWSVAPKFLDPKIKTSRVPAVPTENKVLAELRSKKGEELIVHVAIATEESQHFARDMYYYDTDLKEAFPGKEVLSVAFLADGNPNWLPNSYQVEVKGSAPKAGSKNFRMPGSRGIRPRP